MILSLSTLTIPLHHWQFSLVASSQKLAKAMDRSEHYYTLWVATVNFQNLKDGSVLKHSVNIKIRMGHTLIFYQYKQQKIDHYYNLS